MAVIAKLDDKLCYVPRREELNPNPDARNRLLDSLFRPTHLDWSPYCLNLPFRRDAVDEIAAMVNGSDEHSLTRIGGEAGIGKTVVLRSVAFDLAQDRNLCLWFRRSYEAATESMLSAIVSTLNGEVSTQKVDCVVFFVDDPIGLQLNDELLHSVLQRAKFPWRVVVCQRSSESAMSESIQFDYDISPSFSDKEKERFVDYLVSLGVAENIEVARSQVRAKGVTDAKDILCNLWYALPQTQAVLANAVSGEYDRLSGIEGYIKAFVGVERMSLARNAYEMVTVCSGLANIGVPVEVLVNSLEIGYEEWGMLCSAGKPVWGLIYDEENLAISSWVYRTRNRVVTEIMLHHLNKGATEHSAEFRIILKMVRACNSGQAPYRQFLFDVLINSRKTIQEKFSLYQAMEIYDAALEAFPRAFGSLEYHRSLCKRALGGDSLEVYDELTGLLRRQVNTDEEIDSPDKLLTSAAAAMLQARNEKKVSDKEASEAIYRHTTEALNIAPHSLHPIHAQANALLKIGSEIRATNRMESMENVVRAANLVERSLMSIDANTLLRHSDIEGFKMFNDLREAYLMALPDSVDTNKDLLENFEKSNNQIFLILACRVALGKAMESGKGGRFKRADDVIRDAFRLADTKGQEPDVDLRICRVQLDFEWKLKRHSGPVYWEQFSDDLQSIRGHRRFRDDPMWDFLLAVAKFHLKDFNFSDQLFSRLRSRKLDRHFRRQGRCKYIGDKGSVQTLEGSVTIGPEGKSYLLSAELGSDVRGKVGSFRKDTEEIKFFQIEFSMTGPLAVPSE